MERHVEDSSGRSPVARNPVTTRIGNLFWEVSLGISTRGVVDVRQPDAHHYATMSYAAIRKVLEFLSLDERDVVVDIGCGKGRVLCSAARRHVRRVVGVDLSEELCRQARANAARLRGRRAEVTVHHANAQEFGYEDGTVFFLFNPFGPATLDAVLSKIRDDVGDRPVRVAYANPTHDEVFARHPWLERYAHWDKERTSLEHSVSFYRS